MELPLIEFRGVAKHFGDRTILDKVDLSIYEGQTTTIIGKSGVGKSVTLKHIIGLLEPDDGEIFFGGRSLREMSRVERGAVRRQFSYMFQNNALFDSMTVFENIALPLVEKTQLPREEVERRVVSRIDQLELSDVMHKYPSQISGGMQKRVALARALVTEPKIVLFDEPTTGLDPIRKNAVLGMIAHYRRQFGFTAVVVSHDIPDVFFISNRIAILYDGKVIFQGSPFDLEQFDHPLIEEFISSLRSLKDELTGFETRRSFERQYQHEFGPVRAMEEFTVVLFSVQDLSVARDHREKSDAGHALQSLASLIDRHIGVLGISARYSPHEILSILPDADQQRAGVLLEELAKDLRCRELFGLQGDAHGSVPFDIRAGMVQGKPGMPLGPLVEEAKSRQASLAELASSRVDEVYDEEVCS